jgi:hypothetical protein
MKQRWNYKDCIDLEYFFQKDINDPPEHIRKRDRNILLKKTEQTGSSIPDNNELISLWLRERIDNEFPGNENKSPGEIFQDTLSLFKGLCIIGGSLFGFAAGLSFFSYSGTTPVNVFQFLIFFIFSQILLTFLMGSSFALRRLAGRGSFPTFYALFFGRLLNKLAQMACNRWNKDLSATKKNNINHAMGVVKSYNRIYGSLFYWPFFTLSQILALSFNAGLLGSTLLKISTSDLAFGWQSTLQLSAAALHKIVLFMALPWSWFVPGTIAFPSPEEIEGSRILLKDGIYHLATKDLVSWWPFLIFCILFYGLFFRGGCYLAGRWMEKRSLQKIQFNSASCRRLTQRMLTPLVSTQAAPEAKPRRSASKSTAETEQFQPAPGHHLLPQFVLIPCDIYHTIPSQNFKHILHSHGFEVKKQLMFMSDYESDQEIKQYLQQQVWDDNTGIFILMEGWMVPLVDFLTYLGELRSVVGAGTVITIALTGRPAKTSFTPVSKNDYTIWQQKAASLGDPYLYLFPLISAQGT